MTNRKENGQNLKRKLVRVYDRLFRKEKFRREQLLEAAQNYGDTTGLRIREQELQSIGALERLFICLLKGIVVGAIVCGSIGCFVTACGLPCNMLAVCLVVFTVAIICSLLFYSQILYNIGLILIFILFCYCVIRFFGAFNSGFSAIINILVDYVDRLMNLEGLRQFTESISNRYYTITMCLSLIGGVWALVMNSVFNGLHRFSIFMAASGFLLCVCFFLELSPDVFWLCVMLWGYTIAIVLCMSNHVRLPGKNERIFFAVKRGRKHRTDQGKQAADTETTEYTYVHQNNGRGMLYNGLFLGAVYVCVGMILAGINSFGAFVQTPNNRTTARHMLDDFVRDATVNGILGFFDEYSSNGGINSGQLGGVRSVNLDFQTDLIVDYVPYTTDRVYIKMFSGENYTGYSWETPSGNAVYDDIRGQLPDSDINSDTEYPLAELGLLDFVNKESLRLKSAYEQGASGENGGVFSSRMRIEVVEHSVKGAHTPYYTLVTEDSAYLAADPEEDFVKFISDIRGDFMLGRSPLEAYDTYYYGVSGDLPVAELAKYATEEQQELLAFYEEEYLERNLYVPEELHETLQRFCDENGIEGSREEVIEALLQCFSEDFAYTYSPGKTPKKTDFVTYFLETQKKGYCVYFASAAVLLLRENGIPARYCEGYCIDYEEMIDGDILSEESYKEWYDGYNSLGETAVVRVELSDASAHAWVEIYEEGFGWVPYEFTVSQMESGEYASFWSQFSQLLSQGNDNGNQNSDNGQLAGNDFAEAGQQALNMLRQLLLWVLTSAVVLGVVLYAAGKIIWLLRLYGIGSFQARLEYQYHMINLLVWRFGEETGNRRYSNRHGETVTRLMDAYHMRDMEEALQEWSRLLVKMSYSPYRPDRIQYENCSQVYRTVRKRIYRGQKSPAAKLRMALTEGITLR